MGVEPDEFDLEAAWLRRAQGDLRAFTEALAVRLEQALPQHVAIDRRRDGLLAKTSHVARIEFRTDTAIWTAVPVKGVLQTTRAKVVRGVLISTVTLPVAQWLSEVRAAARALAEQAGGAADVLHDFL